MRGRNVRCAIANRLWKLSSVSGYRRFSSALHSVEEIQREYLLRLLRNNRGCVFGLSRKFDAIPSVKEYQGCVPLSTYEDYVPYIDRIAQGEKGILTAENVERFVASSGSTSARKLIPYTASLRQEFQAAISPWFVSLFERFPDLVNGRAYWSLSPPSGDERPLCGKIRVGFDEDSSYLGRVGKKMFSYASVRPDSVSSTNMDAFRIATLSCLLAAEDLRLISVWSPSFLRLLLEWYEQHRELVFEALLQLPDVTTKRIHKLKSFPEGSFEQIWHHLQVISCWTDSTSQREVQSLRKYFPNVCIQGKGLLATEGFVTLPFLPDQDPVLAVRSHFFEFLAENGHCLLAHQLTLGETYSVVLTTGGGLYRYQLHDRVLVTGAIGGAPTMKFLGKAGHISDLFGEKLNAAHVSDLTDGLLRQIPHEFAMLAPELNENGWCYTLYVEAEGLLPGNLADQLDKGLRENPHYDYCVALGQLQPARVFLISRGATCAYTERLLKTGMKLGEIKNVSLSTKSGWSEVFQGEHMERFGT